MRWHRLCGKDWSLGHSQDLCRGRKGVGERTPSPLPFLGGEVLTDFQPHLPYPDNYQGEDLYCKLCCGQINLLPSLWKPSKETFKLEGTFPNLSPFWHLFWSVCTCFKSTGTPLSLVDVVSHCFRCVFSCTCLSTKTLIADCDLANEN